MAVWRCQFRQMIRQLKLLAKFFNAGSIHALTQPSHTVYVLIWKWGRGRRETGSGSILCLPHDDDPVLSWIPIQTACHFRFSRSCWSTHHPDYIFYKNLCTHSWSHHLCRARKLESLLTSAQQHDFPRRSILNELHMAKDFTRGTASNLHLYFIRAI